jgi:hypothetical protein
VVHREELAWRAELERRKGAERGEETTAEEMVVVVVRLERQGG